MRLRLADVPELIGQLIIFAERAHVRLDDGGRRLGAISLGLILSCAQLALAFTELFGGLSDVALAILMMLDDHRHSGLLPPVFEPLPDPFCDLLRRLGLQAGEAWRHVVSQSHSPTLGVDETPRVILCQGIFFGGFVGAGLTH